MTTLEQAARLTLDAIEQGVSFDHLDNVTAAVLRTALEHTCNWKQHDDVYMPDTWEGDCGATWTFTEGSPTENDMHYCPWCGAKLKEITMTNKHDPYASEEETRALLLRTAPRSDAEKKLDAMLEEAGAWEQGAEPYLVLRQIAVKLLEQMA